MYSLVAQSLLQGLQEMGALRVLRAGLELGLFTELGRGPRSREQLCRGLGLDADAAQDFLDALLSLGWLEREGDDGRAVYVNTREAALCLDQRSPAYLGTDLLQLIDGQWLCPAAGLASTLRVGAQAGKPPPAAAHMHAQLNDWQAEMLAARLDFSPWRRLLGVDGARGAADSLVCAIVARHPHLHGVALVAAPQVAAARARVQAHGLANRVQCQAQPATTNAWPQTDVLVLSLIAAGASRARRQALLKRARAALPDDGCLVLIDYLPDPARRHSPAALLHGLARRLDGEAGAAGLNEVQSACRQVGFASLDCLPLVGGACAVVARA